MPNGKIGVSRVRGALQEVVAEDPQRVDRRSTDNLPPRYVEHGQPNCLVAALLARMGISLGLLKQLDNEVRGPGGILLWVSKHAIRRRFTPAAWELLAALQACNDRGNTWQRASEDVFTPGKWIGRRWQPRNNEGRPWMDELDDKEA